MAASTAFARRRPGCHSFQDILNDFPAVIFNNKCPAKPLHGVEHHLETQGRPVTAKFRRLDPEKLAAAKAEFDRMEAEGIVQRSSSAWSSPLHMVRRATAAGAPAATFGGST